MRWLAAVLLVLTLSSAAQISLNLGDTPKPDVVARIEPQLIAAGKHQNLELAFQVKKGLHINSHKPGSDYLLPTGLTLQSEQGLTVGKMLYAPGQPYSFSFDPKDKLEVYTDLFHIQVDVHAAQHGSFVLHGTLRYQACDNASCFPPQTVPVKVEVEAR